MMLRVFQGVTDEQLRRRIARFSGVRVAVVGDFFLDKYLEVDPALAELSVETGKVAHQVVAARGSPGAAGTVVNNLAALGAGRIEAVGLIGDDGEGFELRRALAALGCGIEHLHVAADRFTPTYLKPRDRDDPTLAGEHSRYDTKNRRPTPPRWIERIIASLDALLGELDAVIIADQVEEDECGVVTAAVRDALESRAAGRSGVVFWADSRRRIRRFRRVIIKPNQFEAAGIEPPPPQGSVPRDVLAGAMEALERETGAPVCITLGAAGMLVSRPEPTLVPGVRLEGPVDPTGAGDSATAGAVLALAAGAALPEAALVGNLVASITVEQLATTGTACPEELPARLELWRRQQSA